MIDVTAPPFPIAPPASPDSDNPAFSFDTTEWLVPPEIPDSHDDNPGSPDSRISLLNQYRSLVDPTKWHRYIMLGFHAYVDGREFESVWNTQPVDWLKRHKIIWYSYMHHVDHQLDIPPKLFAWATQITKAFLLYHEPSFVEIDTTAPNTLKQILNVPPWKTVGPKSSKKVTYALGTTKAPDPAYRIRPPVQAGGSSLANAAKPAEAPVTILTPLKLPALKSKDTGSILDRMSAKSGDAIRAAWKPQSPPAVPLPKHTNTDLEPQAQKLTSQQSASDIPVDDEDMSDAKQSAFQTLLNVPTNDGTHRITVRWTPSKHDLSPERNPGEWTQEALRMLQDLFQDAHGVLYRWESQDLSRWIQLSTLTPGELRDFISPSITYVQSRKMFVFGVRFGFSSKHPISWQHQASTKQAMRDHKVWTTISNSSCLSGKLVTAGFILMKAPNTTHRIRYLQSLRNKLPDNTPFFDITLLKKTPLDQPIHHLAVQCGEHHVAPLTKALSGVMTGANCAVFLPRIVLGNLSSDQLTKYFKAHADYVKSLRPISLAPFVTNLDTVREELHSNGEVLKRTTRDWATSITVPSTGASARCDIVNGGPDQTATLLVPRHVYAEVQDEVSRYKLRINPLSRREARFLDNIPGLPAVIHIDLSVQQSLDCLELMSTEDIWKQQALPEHNPTPAEATRPSNKSKRSSRTPKSASASQLSGTTDHSDFSHQDTVPSSKDHDKSKSAQSGTSTNAWGLASTASTHSGMTPSIATTQNQEYLDLERLLDSQQAQLEKVQEESASRWNQLDNQVKEQQANQTERFDTLERTVTKTMRSLTTNNANMTALQTQFNEMMKMMQSLSKKASRKRSKTKHLQPQLSRPNDVDSASQDAIMYPLTAASLPTGDNTTSQPATESASDSEDIYSAPVPDADMPPAPTEVRNKKRSATDLMEQLEEMSEASSDSESATQISGVSHLHQEDESDDMLSDTESLSSEFQRILADSSNIPAEAQSSAINNPSPPLDAQYTHPSDPAGGTPG
jgi:hypothetical protein